MNWNYIQNLLSNIVFGILIFNTFIYWLYLNFSKNIKVFERLGKICSSIANILIIILVPPEFDQLKMLLLKCRKEEASFRRGFLI